MIASTYENEHVAFTFLCLDYLISIFFHSQFADFIFFYDIFIILLLLVEHLS